VAFSSDWNDDLKTLLTRFSNDRFPARVSRFVAV